MWAHKSGSVGGVPGKLGAPTRQAARPREHNGKSRAAKVRAAQRVSDSYVTGVQIRGANATPRRPRPPKTAALSSQIPSLRLRTRPRLRSRPRLRFRLRLRTRPRLRSRPRLPHSPRISARTTVAMGEAEPVRRRNAALFSPAKRFDSYAAASLLPHIAMSELEARSVAEALAGGAARSGSALPHRAW